MFELPTFTLIHVLISVLGIITGLVVIGGLIAGARLDVWTALFLVTTVLTSVTGFGFPFTKVQPPHVVGVLSLVVLAVCVAARYWMKMAGLWRGAYVVTAVVAVYLNSFVLVVQLFLKTPPLSQLAPTQQEAPFALTQGLVLALFVWLGWAAWRGFGAQLGDRAPGVVAQPTTR
ncbi:MAG TPA: hypothetical protein VFO28_13520 [Burkholderiaceae bacterium]|nr:hypothetical protein [Burkholderiaceae bacterium]